MVSLSESDVKERLAVALYGENAAFSVPFMHHTVLAEVLAMLTEAVEAARAEGGLLAATMAQARGGSSAALFVQTPDGLWRRVNDEWPLTTEGFDHQYPIHLRSKP